MMHAFMVREPSRAGCGYSIAGRAGPGKGWGALELTPGAERDEAVSATALAGCGRGRDGRVWEKWRIRDGNVALPPGSPTVKSLRVDLWSLSDHKSTRVPW